MRNVTVTEERRGDRGEKRRGEESSNEALLTQHTSKLSWVAACISVSSSATTDWLIHLQSRFLLSQSMFTLFCMHMCIHPCSNTLISSDGLTRKTLISLCWVMLSQQSLIRQRGNFTCLAWRGGRGSGSDQDVTKSTYPLSGRKLSKWKGA